MNRRRFLMSVAAFGGGMALSMVLPRGASAAWADSKPWKQAPGGHEFSPWVAITADDQVIIRVPTPEIGNGAMTQMAMNVVEELACDWQKVKTEFAPVSRDYAENGVYAIGFLPYFGGHGTDHVRMAHALQVGASARERLRQAAADHWGVPVAEIAAANSVLTHEPSGRTLSYGEMAAAAATVALTAEPALKPQSEWSFLGKASPGKLNGPDIVNGTATYGIDVSLPGMVHAAVKQCPVHGGSLTSHDPEAVLAMPGVRAVVVLDAANTAGAPVTAKATFGLQGTELQSGVAVIADHYWQAQRALAALPVTWDPGHGETWSSSEQLTEAMIDSLDSAEARVVAQRGDVASAQGSQSLEAVYTTPFCDHVTMEPINGTALVSDDGLEIWHPCQDTIQAFWVAVDESGAMPEKVTVNQTYVGGGFGRRTTAHDVRVSVAIARAYPGVPVKMIWSREETTRQGRYRQMIAGKYSATLDDGGMPASIRAHAAIAGATAIPMTLGFHDSPYLLAGAIPNVAFRTSNFPVHLLAGAFRAPCYNSHAFMLETFVDECAVAGGRDPLAYRLKLLENWDPAWSRCLEVAADKIGWGRPLPPGEGMGIAIANWPKGGERQAGSTLCVAAHVAVSRAGELSVKRLDCTFDCGRVANRDAVHAQIEGGVIFGMNVALNEAITLDNGAVVEGNYHQYPMLKLADMPEINVHFDALSGHDRFEIIGEAPVGPVGPAIGNAIFQATGKRLRSTPFRHHDLSWG